MWNFHVWVECFINGNWYCIDSSPVYRNNKNEEVWSNKNHYWLSKQLTILTNIGGEKYTELDNNFQKRQNWQMI
jgi:transglutaminase-like putative cysteine protease